MSKTSGGGQSLKVKNAVEKNNQKSLEPIEKMNFVSLLETGNMQKIGQISIAVSSKGAQICGLGKDIYIVASSRYLQAFQYRDGVFSLGESVDTGVNGVYGDTLTSITPDPKGLGCFFIRGNGSDYEKTAATYAKVNEDDLSIRYVVLRTTTPSYAYCAQSHFMYDDLIVGNTGDCINGIFRIDREHMELTEVSATKIEKVHDTVKLSDNTILAYSTGGNIKSWYLKLLRIDADGTITEGASTLISATDSGISHGRIILQLSNGDVYVPIASGNLFKVSYDLDTLDVTASSVPYVLPNYRYDVGNAICNVGDDLYHVSSDIKYVATNTYETSVTITGVQATSGGLNIQNKGTFKTETKIKYNYYPAITSEAGSPKCLICADKDIYACVMAPGYEIAKSGGKCNGISLNTVPRHSDDLKILSV